MATEQAHSTTLPAVEKQIRIHRRLNHIRAGSRIVNADLPPQVSQVLDYIHEHLFEPTLNACAVRRGCSSLIGMAVGYCHEETFSRAFRRRFDCPPSVYRRRV